MKLFVKETTGQYREALPTELFNAAKIAANELLAKGEEMDSPSKVRDYLAAQLLGLKHEAFGVLFMDTQHKVIEYREMFQGTIDSCPVYVREVAKAALELNASALIFCHNHPSGKAEESAADRSITKRLKEGLATLDIRTLDHIIVAGSETMSFADKGLI